MYHYRVSLAGISFLYEVPFLVSIPQAYIPFITESCEMDVRYHFQFGDRDREQMLIHQNEPRVWMDGKGYRIERKYTTNPAVGLLFDPNDRTTYNGVIYPGNEDALHTLGDLVNYSELELPFAAFHAFMLHSSLIRAEGAGILFSAPSGTGKSTQADLWTHHRNAVVINGDRALIRKECNGWFAYGSPFAGTSGIYVKEKVPVRFIVVLRQGRKNTITELSRGEAFRYLYQEATIPTWNLTVQCEIMDLIERLVEEVPVVLLKATPDEYAVERLHTYMETHIK